MKKILVVLSLVAAVCWCSGAFAQCVGNRCWISEQAVVVDDAVPPCGEVEAVAPCEGVQAVEPCARVEFGGESVAWRRVRTSRRCSGRLFGRIVRTPACASARVRVVEGYRSCRDGACSF